MNASDSYFKEELYGTNSGCLVYIITGRMNIQDTMTQDHNLSVSCMGTPSHKCFSGLYNQEGILKNTDMGALQVL